MIGAGPAGLAAAGAMARRGISATILEQGAIAESWRRRYDRVRLNTSSWMSYLPAAARPLIAGGRFPARLQLVEYYERYAADLGLEVRGRTRATRIVPGRRGWSLELAQGDEVRCSGVIVATGKDRIPIIPHWPGREAFQAQLLHAAAYRNAKPFRGCDTLVVGVGNSGSEIALDLVQGGARTVRLAVRTPPNITARTVAGVPTDVFGPVLRRLPVSLVDDLAWRLQRARFGDLRPYGLGRPPEGPYTRLRRRGTIPTIDAGAFVETVKTGAIEVVAGVDRLEREAVVLSDGTRLRVDAVIAATGYRAGLEPLVGHLGVLNDRGRPIHHGAATHPTAPRLHFIGFTDTLSGNIRETRLVARHIARAVSPKRSAETEGRSSTRRS